MGRAFYAGGFIPGKIRRDWTGCDVPYGGRENFVSSYNVLVPNFKTPTTLFQAGTDWNGTTLGVCHARYSSSEQVGKYLSWGACNFGFGGQEVSLTSGYQVLSF